MNHLEAGRIRACVGCAAPGAWLYRTTKGANPGRNLRLCETCLGTGDWYKYGLVAREPLPIEGPTRAQEPR